MTALAPSRPSLVRADRQRRELWTTSLLVAQAFGKRHADVLRAISNTECSEGFTERNFALSEYVDPTGRTLPMVRISE